MLTKPHSCYGCALHTLGTGFMAPAGTGKNGVMLCGEALGSEEAQAGIPFVGKAGQKLDKMLSRGHMERDDFTIANTLWCQPPANKIQKMWYAYPAIHHCSPNLDGVIRERQPKVIVALGDVAARRLIPNLPDTITKVRGYVFWNEKYECWVIPTVHPSFIMRGKTAWEQVLIHDVQRAVEIARDGYAYTTPDYTLDCTALEAHHWVDNFERYYASNPDLFLSCDIETPEKTADEEDLDLEEGSDYIILRCGYSYKKGHALSIPWDGMYKTVHDRLLKHPSQKVWWNGGYDIPRIYAAGVSIGGVCHDAMDAWHVLNSDLKKSLGFVTTFFYHGQPCWKHLNGEKPAYYNAVDADAAGVNMRGSVELLKKHGMWGVYEEFIVELDPVFSSMTKAGMPVDRAKRIESSLKLQALKEETRKKIDTLIPDAIRVKHPEMGYVKIPADTTDLQQFIFEGIPIKFCGKCGLKAPKAEHLKSKIHKYCALCGKKWTAKHSDKPKKKINPCLGAECLSDETNPCAGAEVVVREEGEVRWARLEPFLPSTKGVLNYLAYHKIPPITVGVGEEKKATTDEKALKTLMGRYPEDRFFELVLDDREYSKLLGTYIGYAIKD